MATKGKTQLTTAQGYNINQMIFSDPIPGSVPDSIPKIEFKRINISTVYDDGTVGDLIFPTERLYSYGVTENVSQESQKVTGFTFPLCLWNIDGATQAEKGWVQTFEDVVEHCMEHVLENQEEIDIEVSRAELTKTKGGFNPLYWKREKIEDKETGKTKTQKVPGRGPTLYTKLIYSKKNEKFITRFFDTNDNPIQPLDLMGKRCHAEAAVKIESIFISGTGKVSLQVKLYEAVVELADTGMERLLGRPKARSQVLAAKSGKQSAGAIMANDEEEDEENNLDDNEDSGSLVGSPDGLDGNIEDEEDTPVVQTTPEPKKKVIKRTVKKVARK